MRPSAGPTKTSMVGYRRLKNLIIWSLAILVLIALFYFYFGSDSKTSGPLKNLTLVLSTTSAIASEGGLKPYDNAIQFDSVSEMWCNVLRWFYAVVLRFKRTFCKTSLLMRLTGYLIMIGALRQDLLLKKNKIIAAVMGNRNPWLIESSRAEEKQLTC